MALRNESADISGLKLEHTAATTYCERLVAKMAMLPVTRTRKDAQIYTKPHDGPKALWRYYKVVSLSFQIDKRH
jgi:hypothetical protein